MDEETRSYLKSIDEKLRALDKGTLTPDLLSVYANPQVLPLVQYEYLPCLLLFYDIVFIHVAGAGDLSHLIETHPQFKDFFTQGLFAPMFGSGSITLHLEAVAEQVPDLSGAIDCTHIPDATGLGGGVVPGIVHRQRNEPRVVQAALELVRRHPELDHGRWDWEGSYLLYQLNYDLLSSLMWNADLLSSAEVAPLVREILAGEESSPTEPAQRNPIEIYKGLSYYLPPNLSLKQVQEFRSTGAFGNFRAWYSAFRSNHEVRAGTGPSDGLTLAKQLNKEVLSVAGPTGRRQSMEWFINLLFSLLPGPIGTALTLGESRKLSVIRKRIGDQRWRFHFQEWILGEQ